HTLAQDARGWDARRIATFWGRPLEEIEAILNPRPPVRFDTEDNGANLDPVPQGRQSFRDAYRDTVMIFARESVGIQYLNAAYHARCEGWSEEEAEMEAMYRRFWRRCVHTRDWPLFTELDWDDENLRVAVGCCVYDDARHAVAIQPAPES